VLIGDASGFASVGAGVPKPPIVWYGCHPSNVLSKPAGVVPEAICLHTTGGQRTAYG
jgi:hypothetical protein